MSQTSQGLLQSPQNAAGTDWRNYAGCLDVDGADPSARLGAWQFDADRGVLLVGVELRDGDDAMVELDAEDRLRDRAYVTHRLLRRLARVGQDVIPLRAASRASKAARVGSRAGSEGPAARGAALREDDARIFSAR